MAAAVQVNNTNTANEKPQRSCIICCELESDTHLIKPCRICLADYCTECLLDMFLSATTNLSRMPPRCCTLLQIHAVIEQLSEDQAREYRLKFEEWISPTKTYCPVPTCSAFIPEKYLPSISPNAPPTLKSVLREVLVKVCSCSQARFFRGEMDITQLPGFTKVVKQHIDLTIMQDKVDRYRSANELTADMRLLVSNAVEYNGHGHPVSRVADELFGTYLLEISNATDRLITATSTPTGPQIFGCPKCHIAICSDCKQVDHTGNACDRTSGDHETAMLAAFGYKKCPRCGTGVKRMFGCSHMQCVCGAHWCYWCQKSTEECHGDCHGPDSEDEEDDDGYDSEDSERENDEDDGDQVMILNQEPLAPPGVDTGQVSIQVVHTAYRVENLDAGGARRWAETDYDFGSEPEDEPYAQVWSCRHTFKAYRAPMSDGFDRGNLDRMECNRCFGHVQPLKAINESQISEKSIGRIRARVGARSKKDCAETQPPSDTNVIDEQTALECCRCRLLVCSKCRDKYLLENKTLRSG